MWGIRRQGASENHCQNEHSLLTIASLIGIIRSRSYFMSSYQISRPKQPLRATEYAVLALLALKPCHGLRAGIQVCRPVDLDLVCRAYVQELEGILAIVPPDGFRNLVLACKVNAAEGTITWLEKQRHSWVERH